MRTYLYFPKIFIFIGCAFLLSGCSFLKSDEEKAEDFYQSGMIKIETGQLKSAIIEFKNAVQKNPNLAKAYFQLGLAYIADQQVLLGIIELRTAVRLAPENDAFLTVYAEILLEHRYYKDAAKYLERMAEKSPEDLDLLLKLGNTQLKSKWFGQASETFNRIIQKEPDSVRAKIGLANALYRQSQFQDAQEVLEQNASSAQNNMEAQVALARFFEKRGRYDAALELFQKISRRFSELPESQLAHAQYLFRRKQYKSALQIAEKATKSNLNHPTLFHIKAYLKNRNGQKKAALEALQEAVRLFPENQKSWIFLGDHYRRTRQYSKARQIYREALSKSPEKVDLKLGIVNAYYREGRYKKATTEVEKVLEEHPDNSRAHYLYGKALWKEGKKGKAKEEFRLAKEHGSENSNAYYYYGLSLFEEKQYEKAKMEITTALALDQKSTRARMLLAKIYYRINDNERSLNAVNQILEVRAKDVDARKLRGKIYAKMKKYTAAISDYQYVASREKNDVDIRLKLAALYQAQGQTEKALAAFKALLNIYPEKRRPLAKMLQIYLSTKQCNKAIELCNQVRKEEPGDLKIAILASQVLIDCGKKKEAKKLLRQLAKTHSESARPHIILGDLASYTDKDFSAAIQYYNKALERNPYSLSAYFGQADTYEETGQESLAEMSYEKLLEIDPDNIRALNNLAFLYARSNRELDKALALAKKADSLAPGDPEVLDTLGFIQLKKGSFLLAKKNLTEAFKKAPGDGSINFHMGLYEYRHNNFRAARPYFKRALESDVDRKAADSILAYENQMKTIGNKMREAETCVERGEPKQAIVIYEGILDSIGFYAPVAVKLASLYAESGRNLEKAATLAEKAKETLPADAFLLNTLGLIYFKKGSFLLAKRYFHEAIRISPEIALFHYHIGRLYFAENDVQKARHALQDAIRLGLSGKALISAEEMMKEPQTSSSGSDILMPSR